LTRRYLIEGSRVARVLVFALAPRVRKNPKAEEDPINGYFPTGKQALPDAVFNPAEDILHSLDSFLLVQQR
jgi:hypothetical protein